MKSTISPVSNSEVKKDNVQDIVDFIINNKNKRIIITSPIYQYTGRTVSDELSSLQQKGFDRLFVNDAQKDIEEVIQELATEVKPKAKKTAAKKTIAKATDSIVESIPVLIPGFNLLIDRVVVGEQVDDDLLARLSDSAQIAFNEGRGVCRLYLLEDSNVTAKEFSNRFEADGIIFEEPSVHLFSFNNPFGACKKCEGFGSVIGVDEDLVIPDKSLSIYDGAILCWRGEKLKDWNDRLVMNAHKFDFPIHKPYYDLNESDKKLLWTGNKFFKGLNQFFEHLESQMYKIQYRVMLARYRGKKACPECRGTRLRKDANYVKVGGLSISDIVLMPVDEAYQFFAKLKFEKQDEQIGNRLMTEINSRLQFLNDVGLGYLTLNRLSNSLSGGESQRINLATSLGSTLVGSMYILDEPSIGLHSRDTEKLIGVLKSLKQIGNTVIVVEHDEEIMRAADQLIDIGPMAGVHGGQLIFQGDANALMKEEHSLTAKYLTGKEVIPIPLQRRKWKKYVEIKGARENNLKNVNVKFPMGVLTVVTGVSGSGKTSLVKKILFPAIKKTIGGFTEATGNFDRMDGNYQEFKDAEMVDQNPIGKSSRSNPVTYVKAFDEIRSLYADLPLARQRGLKPSHFSFNVEGGRCEFCHGDGIITVEMQFMADIHLKCDHCNGQRFKDEILAVEYRGKNIFNILELTVDEALEFFAESQGPEKYKSLHQKIVNKIQPLADVGLGYIGLGQASSTLSGGEAQRIKLASYLGKGNQATNTLFVFDEPTTGLHFHDIRKLLDAFNALVRNGNTLIVIEHNMEIIKSADWIIDLGPEGGNGGGEIIFEGVPEDLINDNKSVTGVYLKSKFKE
ncbi:MAG: excinuclease ABC subunit UvrA [Bacteroidota bacterium]